MSLYLVLVASLLLFMAGVTWALVASRQRTSWLQRAEKVLDGNRVAKLEPAPAWPLLKRRLLGSPLVQRLSTLFGMRLDHLEGYRPRWYFVLGLAVIIGRVAGGFLGDLLGEVFVLPAAVAIFLVTCRGAFAYLNRRRRDYLFRQFPDALGQITRAVRVGIPVVEAVRQVASEAPQPTATEFGATSDRLVLGVPLDEALADTAMRTGVPEYRFFATALALQARTGGGLAETLDNLAEVIRKRVALRERGHALASEARTSAIILASLPFVTGGMLLVLNPSYAGVLFYTPNGKMALGIAAGMLTMGMLSMRFVIRRALS